MENGKDFKKDIKVDNSKELSIEFNRLYNELKDLLNSIFSELINTPDLRLKRNSEKLQSIISNINNKDLLKVYRLIQELSKSEYKPFLDSISEYETLPIDKQDIEKISHEEAIENAKTEVKITKYIKDIIYAYSIYHNHDIRNYYSALCAHIASTYSQRYEEKVNIFFRYKSSKELIIKLAKIIFVYTPFDLNPDGKHFRFNPTPLQDIFGIKIVPEKDIDHISSKTSELAEFVSKREELESKIEEFNDFRYIINTNPDKIDIETYLEKCYELLAFRLKYTINKEQTKLEEYIKIRLDQILTKYNDFKSDGGDLTSSYESVLADEEGFNFQHWHNVCIDEINSPLTYYVLNKRIKTILIPSTEMTPSKMKYPRYIQDFITSSFGISVSKTEDKNTASAHMACHYDITTKYGRIEAQAETPLGYKRDGHGPVTAHGLMPNKLPPDFGVPTEVLERRKLYCCRAEKKLLKYVIHMEFGIFLILKLSKILMIQ